MARNLLRHRQLCAPDTPARHRRARTFLSPRCRQDIDTAHALCAPLPAPAHASACVRHVETQTYRARQTDRRTDRQANIWIGGQRDRERHKQTDRQTNRQTDIKTDRHKDRQTNRQTDIQTYRHTDTQTDKQTNRHIDYTQTHTSPDGSMMAATSLPTASSNVSYPSRSGSCSAGLPPSMPLICFVWTYLATQRCKSRTH